MREIVLASQSPRRKELLQKIVQDFRIDISLIPEKKPLLYPLKKVPQYLAKQKALDVYQRNQESLVLAADTIVICKHQILGKPKNKMDAQRMITLLSGKTHIVVTGVYLKCKEFHKSFSCVTKVTFKKLSNQEIEEYCKLTTIYDKAGAYAIQGEAKKFIFKIKGSYDNVVGLPIEKLKTYFN